MADEHPDEPLWRAAQQGSAEAFTQLRQRYQNLVRSELQRRCLRACYADVQDLEQEVWIVVWRALAHFQGRSGFATWLIGVTRNLVGAWLRRRRNYDLRLLRLREFDSTENEGPDVIDPLADEGVRGGLRGLSEPEQQVIRLRYFEQLTDRAIANRLRVPLGTVKGRIRKGLTHLRENLRSTVSVLMAGLLWWSDSADLVLSVMLS